VLATLCRRADVLSRNEADSNKSAEAPNKVKSSVFGCSRSGFVCAGLPQYYLRRILEVGNDQKPLRCRRVWIIACQRFQRSDRLDNTCAIGICFQDRKWLKFAEWRLIR